MYFWWQCDNTFSLAKSGINTLYTLPFQGKAIDQRTYKTVNYNLVGLKQQEKSIVTLIRVPVRDDLYDEDCTVDADHAAKKLVETKWCIVGED